MQDDDLHVSVSLPLSAWAYVGGALTVMAETLVGHEKGEQARLIDESIYDQIKRALTGARHTDRSAA